MVISTGLSLHVVLLPLVLTMLDGSSVATIGDVSAEPSRCGLSASMTGSLAAGCCLAALGCRTSSIGSCIFGAVIPPGVPFSGTSKSMSFSLILIPGSETALIEVVDEVTAE